MHRIDAVNVLDVDIKLLRALQAVLEERSVTRAAKRVGLSQPAMSNALARLRLLLDDPILVRTAQGMMPTARAQEIADPVRRAVEQIESALRPRDAFDPATSDRTFTLAATDYAELLLLPTLMANLRKAAPRVNIAVQPLIACDGYKDLARGGVDVMLGFSTEVPEGLYRQVLYADRFVCILRKGHPEARRDLTLERYLALSHVLVSPRGESLGVVDDVIAERGFRRRVALSVPHFLMAPLVVAESDCIATVAARLAQHSGDLVSLVIREPPIKLPGFSLTQIWHERTHRSPPHVWFRRLLARIARDADGTAAAAE